MNGRELSAALRGGRRVYGTAILSTSPRWPAMVKKLGIDLVFIDTEHVPIGRETLSWMCTAYSALGMAPIVRIPKPDPYQANMVLDGGASGIIAPYVETVEEVEALRGAVKLRPLKGRILGEVLAGTSSLEPELADYLADSNADNVLIINIESRPAIEALDDILAVPGLDAVLIGPHDLTCSLGIPEQYEHPLFDEAVRTILRKARANNVGAGIHFWTAIEQEISWAKEEGANLIMHSCDMTAMTQALSADFERLRQALEDTRPRDEDQDVIV